MEWRLVVLEIAFDLQARLSLGTRRTKRGADQTRIMDLTEQAEQGESISTGSSDTHVTGNADRVIHFGGPINPQLR